MYPLSFLDLHGFDLIEVSAHLVQLMLQCFLLLNMFVDIILHFFETLMQYLFINLMLRQFLLYLHFLSPNLMNLFLIQIFFAHQFLVFAKYNLKTSTACVELIDVCTFQSFENLPEFLLCIRNPLMLALD